MSNNNPLPIPPTTEAMLGFLQLVTPILEDVEGHRSIANQYAARLQERGIDYRTGLPIDDGSEAAPTPDTNDDGTEQGENSPEGDVVTDLSDDDMVLPPPDGE
jgi:hypothetical protein